MMMLENLAKPEWLAAPCDVSIIPDVICVKDDTDPNNITERTKPRANLFVQTGDIRMNTLNLFSCLNGEFVSSKLICDGVKNCPQGDDEQECNCFIGHTVIYNSTYCLKFCLLPTCTCPEPFIQKDAFGCQKYFPDNLERPHTRGIEIQLFSCSDHHIVYQSVKGNCTFLKHNLRPNTDTDENCSNELLIPHEYVDDLIPDCPQNEDEGEYNNLHKYNLYRYNKRSIHGQISCFMGHSKCYNAEEDCMYELDNCGHLKFCRNGAHLADCSSKNCSVFAKFKCPKSYYCIPYAYICNGRIDWPRGIDELYCEDWICKGYFHCANSFQCVHLNDLCDGLAHCPLNDDEFMCQTKHRICPLSCRCLHLAVVCKYSVMFSDPDYTVFNQMYVSITNVLPTWGLILSYLPKKALFYIYRGNFLQDLNNLLPDNPLRVFPTKLIDVRNNTISVVQVGFFISLRHLTSLNCYIPRVRSLLRKDCCIF